MKWFLVSVLLTSAWAQTSPVRKEFEAASIRVNPPSAGFHFGADAVTGGPNSADPGLFRCSRCTLATLVSKAFELQSYQFPERSSLGDDTFDLQAKVPEGSSKDEFSAMLPSLLKERFGLAYHFKEKSLRGYHLVVAPGGSKLKESSEKSEEHGYGGSGEAHAHSGAMNFGGTSMYRAQHKTSDEITHIVADQLSAPVDDQTGLTGSYDVALNWSSDSPGAGHSDHNEGHSDHAQAGSAGSSDLTFTQALQSQLGLKLVSSEQITARILVIDHIDRKPTSN